MSGETIPGGRPLRFGEALSFVHANSNRNPLRIRLTGGAVVSSRALLHEATPVTQAARYAFLPFLYDDAVAKLREENNKHLEESIRPYADL